MIPLLIMLTLAQDPLPPHPRELRPPPRRSYRMMPGCIVFVRGSLDGILTPV